MTVYALFFGDIHCHGVNEYSKPALGGLTNLHHQILESLYWVAERVRFHKPKWVVCMGDVGHVPGMMDSASSTVAWRGLSRIGDAAHDVGATDEILVGNHDTSHLEGTHHLVHSIPFFGEALVEEPRTVVCADPPLPESGWKGRALFVPFVEDYKAVETLIAQASEDGCDFVAVHTDALGMMWNSGASSSIGVRTAIANEYGIRVFNGHHHHPESRGLWTDVGSLMYRSFQDSIVGRPRGIALLTKDGVSWEENPHTDLFHTVRSPNAAWSADRLGRSPVAGRLNLRVVLSEEEAPSFKEEGHPFKNLKVLRSRTRKEVKRLTMAPAEAGPKDLFLAYAKQEGVEDDVVEECLRHIVPAAHLEASSAPIEFVSVKAENFMRFKVLRLDLSGAGVRLIDGQNLDATCADSNGAGKSALFESIAWCLTGRTARGIRFGEVIRHGETTCSSEVTFLKGETEYRVIRGWERNVGGSITLFIDGEDKTPYTQAETLKKIEHALGMTIDDFFQICYLNLEESFLDLDDSGRKATLERLIGGPVYATAQKALDKERKKGRLAKEFSEADTAYNRADSAVAQFLAAPVVDRQAELTHLQGQNAAISSEIDVLEKRLVNHQGLSSKLGAELQVLLSTQVEDFDTKISVLRSKVRSAQEDLSSQGAVVGRSRAALEAIEALRSGSCPTCGRSYEFGTDESTRLAQAIEKESWDHTLMDRARDYLDQLQSRLTELETKKANLSSSTQTARVAYDAEVRSISQIEEQINKLRPLVESGEKAISALQANQDEQHRRRDEEGARLELAVKEAASVRKAASRAYEIQEAAYFHLGPEGIRSYAVDRSLGIFNEALHRISEDYYHGETKVEIRPDKAKDGRTVQKLDPIVEPGPLANCSKGECRKAKILTQLALRECFESVRGWLPILVSDECDDGLDATGVQILYSYFASLDKRVFFISHNPIAKSLCSDVTVVVRKNGVSVVEGT